MRQDILDASLRVLRDEGPLRFTTERVAAVAGICVGWLYQYFPNQEAIVLAIRCEMLETGWIEAQRILDDPGLEPRAKLRHIADMYFRAATRATRRSKPTCCPPPWRTSARASPARNCRVPPCKNGRRPPPTWSAANSVSSSTTL